MTRFDRVLGFDEGARRIEAQPGVTLEGVLSVLTS
jgi:FAD/FMN-containing dehydrogenase